MADRTLVVASYPGEHTKDIEAAVAWGYDQGRLSISPPPRPSPRTETPK